MTAAATVPALQECWVNVYSVGGEYLPGRQWSSRESAVASPTPLGARLVLRLHARRRAAAPAPAAVVRNPGMKAAREVRQAEAERVRARVLDLYSSTVLKAREIAVEAGLVTGTVSGMITKARAAKDPRVAAGDAGRARARIVRSAVPQRLTRAPQPAAGLPPAPVGWSRADRDRVLDAFAADGDYSAVLAAKLVMRRADVTAILAEARRDGDSRIAQGDRRVAAKATVTRPAPPVGRNFPAASPGPARLLAAAVPVAAMPAGPEAGQVLAVFTDGNGVVGPRGMWRCSPLVAKALGRMADGQLYGPQVLRAAGFKKSATMEDTVRPWKSSLEKIGVRLVEYPRAGFRIERAEASPP